MKTSKIENKTLYKLMALVVMTMLAIGYSASPFIVSFAAKDSHDSSIIDGVVQYGGSVAAGIVAIFLMISIVKDAVGYAKGSGNSSVLKIVGKVVFMIIMLGLIYLAISYKDLGKKGQDLSNKGFDIVNDVTDHGLGGSTNQQKPGGK